MTAAADQRPRVLVVYESLFGNTADVAREVAAGMSDRAQVSVVEVQQAPALPDESLDLVVVGAPTHAFSMSRPSTREDAVRQGADASHAGTGVREWMDALESGPHRPRVATFDTRVTKVRRIPGSAAKRAAKIARHLGYSVACPPESFYVEDVSGPLAEGELARARVWGEHLAEVCGTAAASR